MIKWERAGMIHLGSRAYSRRCTSVSNRNLNNGVRLDIILGVEKFIFVIFFRRSRVTGSSRRIKISNPSLVLGSLFQMRMLTSQLFHHIFETAALFMLMSKHPLPFATLCLRQLSVFPTRLNKTIILMDQFFFLSATWSYIDHGTWGNTK